jgi:dTDP-4-dehydrorhamnose reductase
MLRLFGERRQVSVVADQWGSPTYTRDLARAIAAVIAHRPARFGIFHYSGEGRTSWCEFARRIHEAARRRGLLDNPVEIRPIATSEYPARAPRPASSYLSKARFVETFGPLVRRWEDSLEAFMEEYAACEASSGS